MNSWRTLIRILELLLPLFAIVVGVPYALANPAESAPVTTGTNVDSDRDAGDSDEESWTTPLPNDREVPHAWLPPGAFSPDRGPSDVIFPSQQITIRFSHKLHVHGLGATCTTCHTTATTSEHAEDRLLPKPTTCDSCHGTSHADLGNVKPGAGTGETREMGKCSLCHDGYVEGSGNVVARTRIPTPNMIFTHKKHADRNIGCQQCHGVVDELDLATRDQMPRMRGCFRCHDMPDSAASSAKSARNQDPSSAKSARNQEQEGDAKGACETCHLRARLPAQGRIQNIFASGKLEPPRWLEGAEHTPDFIERHKTVAGADSALCANCHSEKYCTDCHDGRVRPRNIHPNDYIEMHAIEARQATQKCQSCHQEQTFCLQCHQRLGITMSGPSDVRNSGRFHPPKSIWSDVPRKPGHHAFEAQRNLNACVSCHIERDCVVCHGARGIGGGFNPHRGSFVAGCATQFRRNPRPCYVCHEPGDGALNSCR